MLDCVREQISTEPNFDDRIATVSKIDWSQFLRLAQRHRVVPHVSSSLTGRKAAEVPARVIQRLSKLQMGIARKNLQLTRELLQIFSDFDEQAIQAFTFKGPILAVDLYEGLHRRQFIDLDILIRPKDLVSTLAILQRRGYTNADLAVENLSGSRLTDFLRRFKSHTVIDSDGTYSVDVHWRLSEDAKLFSIPIEELLASDSSCEISGRRFSTMPTEQALEYHAFHACKHGCTRLSWLCDFALFADRIVDADWNRLLKQLRRESARMVVAAMMMLEQLSLTGPLDDRIEGMKTWRRRLGYATGMMMQALLSDDDKAINGTNVGLLRWKLSGNPKFFVDSLFRAVLPKQNDLVEAGVLKPHFSRWNYLIQRGIKSVTSGKPPKSL